MLDIASGSNPCARSNARPPSDCIGANRISPGVRSCDSVTRTPQWHNAHAPSNTRMGPAGASIPDSRGRRGPRRARDTLTRRTGRPALSPG